MFFEWSKGEGIDYVLRKTVQQYAHIVTQQFAGFGATNTPTSDGTTSSTAGTPRPIEVQDLLESLNIVEDTPLRGYWDAVRLEKWSKAEAKMRYTMTICVDDIDSKALKEFNTVKEGWESIWTKYSKIRPATAREDQIKLTNYQWEESQTIDNAWVELKTLRRRAVNANPRLADAYDEQMLLQFLLPALPEEFAITVATLDAQPNLSVQDKLVALRNREDVVRVAKAVEDKALAAKQSAVPKQEKKCDFCHRGAHETDECQFWKAFNEVMEAFVRKQIKRPYGSGNRGGKRDQRDLRDKSKKLVRFDRTKHSTDRKDKKPRPSKHEKGHTADAGSSTDDDSTDDYNTTDSSDDDDSIEHAHLTRDEIRKIPYSY